jgi:hypothetical protein
MKKFFNRHFFLVVVTIVLVFFLINLVLFNSHPQINELQFLERNCEV